MDFTIEEFRTRIEKTQALMAKNNLPVLLVHAPESITYLSGFRMLGFFMYQALIVPASGDPVLVVRDVEQPTADITSWVKERSVYIDIEDPINATQRALKKMGLDGATIGVEYSTWFLTLDRYETLKRLLPNAKFVREPNIVRELRLIKSPAEVEYLRRASRIAEKMVDAAFKASKVGASERDIASAITVAQIQSGGDGHLEPILMTGPRTRELHGTWTDRILEQGDSVYMELNGVVKGYWSKILRTGVLGKPSDHVRKASEVILAALNDGISRMRTGAHAGEIDDALRQPVLKAGLRKSYYHRVGYTMGQLYPPSSGEYLREMMSGDTWTLEAGQVFHMLVIGGGVGFSETVLVTDNGPDILTRYPRQLIEL
ncbi:Xaa-Pro peptidase family protein [Mesorhizobium sp.]|uniref:M24 family metallopeptidase n=1 Tax=Mesorhizobium sp. TaxID=1871066 RepID=UPI000FE45CC0|nr:Xaa-Pro peptidase family protein [Mesorhizobium sp.]RWI88867.1 MAG: aminopeptidase P family protein [Mesorhizobium sp.]